MGSLRLSTLALAVLAAGCSFLVNTAEPDQCSTDRDCQAISALRDRVCREGFCVADPSTLSPEAGAGCVTTELCTQANTGEPSVCKTPGGPCTPWQTPECRYFSGAWGDKKALVIGSIAPFTIKQADFRAKVVPYAHRVRRAIDLAVSDFATEMPGGFFFPGTERRPFAVVHCDSALDPATARAALTHLTEVIGVQAIILGADEDLEALSADLTAKQIAVACSDCLGPLPPGPLVWRVSPPLVDEAPMVAWWVEQLEATIKAGPTPPSSLKVAVLLEPERAHEAFVSALTPMLRFNGLGAIANGSSFRIIRSEDARKKPVMHETYADDLAQFAPDIVIVAMGADFPEFYIPRIEAKWPAGKARPRYVTTTLNFEALPFVDVLADDDLRRRISGVRSATTPENQANVEAFELAYQQANTFEIPDGNYSGYDAFYSMAYAVLTTRTQPIVDGPHIAAGFERLHAGTIIDLRPKPIGFAAALLSDPSTTVDLRGLWSNLDWNASRDLHTDSGMYCFERNATGGLVLEPDAGPRRSAATGVVSGSYSCN